MSANSKSKPEQGNLPGGKNVCPLIFVDTNILLDFYRSRKDVSVELLEKIDSLHSILITTCQVEMEFKRNRQQVIGESIGTMKAPEINLQAPGFLRESASLGVITRHAKDVKKRVGDLKRRMLTTLGNPRTRDKIYQIVQRLFSNKSALNLREESTKYKTVWRRALRRFLTGKPPRKSNDTSAGDAINWEWIIECANDTGRDVIIVSRDSDYGFLSDECSHVNNWLEEEFKARVSAKRKLVLVDRLSEALRIAEVKVTANEAAAERDFVRRSTRIENFKSAVNDAVWANEHQILDTEAVASAIASTNAFGWELTDVSTKSVRKEGGRLIAEVCFSLSGDQHEDKSWFGNVVLGSATVVLDEDGTLEIDDVGASVDRTDDCYLDESSD